LSFSKKLLSVFLAFAVLVIALPLSGISSYASDVSEFTYQVLSEDDKTAEITKYTGAGGDVVIPSEIDGYTITSIGMETFGIEEPNFAVLSLYIPKSVSSVDSVSLAMLAGCASFTVEEGNESYSSANGILYNADKTDLIRYPAQGASSVFQIADTVINIGFGAVAFTNLSEIVIPFGVETVSNFAFAYSTVIETVVFPDSVSFIGENAFDFCSALTSVTLPSTLESLSSYTFDVCSSLKEIMIPESVTSIGWNVFLGTALKIIYGVTGSYAETYANENGYEFIDINDLTIPGDMNGDAFCDLNDIDIMLRISTGVTEPSTVQLKLGDLNNDGVIDGFDVAKLDILISSDASE
jgi:hypothetical protein